MRKKSFAIPLFFVILFSLALLWIKDQTFIVDEGYHFDQIVRFSHGDFRLNQSLVMYPGFHIVVAAVLRIFPIYTIGGIRFIVLVINMLTLPIFYLCARRLALRGALVKTVQLALLPIMFPFFVLIYTDIFSLLLILIALLFSLQKKYYLAGMASGASLFIRQTNIVWLLFVNIVLYIQCYGLIFDRQKFIIHIRKSVWFVWGILGFGIAILRSGSLMLGSDPNSHVRLSWSLLGNNYFLLFIFFLLFFPKIGTQFGILKNTILKKKWVIPLLVIAYIFFLMTFTNDHPYNQATWFIRNMFLVFFSQNLFTKTLYFFGISLGLLSLSVTEFATKWGSLLFPVTFFYLLPFGLVEQRYYFIPIAVYLLVSKPVEKRIEYAQIVYWFILTFILFDGIVKLKFFL